VKYYLLLLVLVLMPMRAYAEDPVLGRPYWSLEMKGGLFEPALPDWAHYYSRRDMPELDLSLAYKVTRRVEIGIESGVLWAKGQGYAPLHGTLGGSVNYDLYPVNLFVLVRGVMDENQWVVPYIGGGYTKMFYSEKIEGQGSVKGSANGYHARGGLQFLLDGLDDSAANSLYGDYGIFHTYFFIEAKYTHAVVASSNLGGTSYLAGLLFEF